VRYQVEGELAPIQICHCSQCRKAQGSAFVTNIAVQESAFALLSGVEQLKAYEPLPGKQRVFCGNCGSPIYSCPSKLPGVLRIRAGSLAGDLATRPGWHAFTASRANWWDIHDDLPQYPAFKP
jgi:hypothetical protein